ncbi:MAG: poly-beta-1,6-N-acetyl-D-glucosamine N-deacetylase PgaB [Pusillimonas sp.]|nr:poly-beta-1,6-N-acetyl-D-glucosamine N-deacetylase PgaB [Pusillimonas sp.]MBC41845.1 poly-beta-1,6-N-acetyl-D-glucosamine N-deacetylase PgaB [Pusillimonas sp.]|tara:strand:+ start:8907 stop:10736 length:1830 start_codon:yes stop_codon:yes gene_type:complete
MKRFLTYHPATYGFLMGCVLVFLAGCQHMGNSGGIEYTSPAQRTKAITEAPWPKNHFLVLAYHDVEDASPDQTFVSVLTEHLRQQFSWLHENNYVPVSIDQILDAKAGRTELPHKAVLLTFDDGYQSFYQHVYPLLKAYQWPAVVAPVGVWTDPPPGASVNFGDLVVPRERFLNWDQITEMSRSGLVEVAAHSNNLHFGIQANPQGNLQPAAAARLYDPLTSTYESDKTYRARISQDVAAITEKITRATGRPPRVWVWPYGTGSGLAAQTIQDHGYPLLLTLEDGLGNTNNFTHVPRLLISNDPVLPSFSNAVLAQENPEIMRVAQVRLDEVYDIDPDQMNRKLGLLIQRIADLQITTVFLDADADTDHDGLPDAFYFPNRLLPVRADLLNRTAWQLRSRAFVDVYASLSPDKVRQVAQNDRDAVALFEDMARNAIFAGVHFRSQGDTPLTQTIAQRMRFIRGDELKTAATAEAGYDDTAQRLPPDTLIALSSLLGQHDWVVVELASAGNQYNEPARRIQRLNPQLNLPPFAAQRLIISFVTGNQPVSSTPDINNVGPERESIDLAQAMRQLQQHGHMSYGYTYDDFLGDRPQMAVIRPVFSNAWYPLK